MHVSDLDTPCLLLDLDALEMNLKTMQTAANRVGKQLRPHAKTHKCSDLAKRQMQEGAIGICAAKVSEAERLVRAGVHDVLITGPIVSPGAMMRLLALLPASPTVTAVVDHLAVARRLESMLADAGRVLDVVIDVDIGLQRTGISPAEILPLAQALETCPHLRLRGLQAYAGHIQHMSSWNDRQMASRQCLAPVLPRFAELRARYPACDILSGAGTGTWDIDTQEPALSELQVGSYAVMDGEYGNIGSRDNPHAFTEFAPALRVLTTVVSANHPGFVTVDAGLKALYRDGGTPSVYSAGPEFVPGTLSYDWFGDEYGKLSATSPRLLPSLGERVQITPSHCDPTINLFDRYHLIRGETVVGEWNIDLRGCCQ